MGEWTGYNSVLLPGADLAGISIDVSGSNNIVFSDFKMDGFALKFNGANSAIGADGTAANPTYGQLTVRGIMLANYENQGLGIGATAGHTCQNVKYLDNFFINCASGAQGANVIDR